jgi:mRNA-degrading endonuclease RelE of RelBE toxin-antitoxin system
MKVIFSTSFRKDYKKLSEKIKKRFELGLEGDILGKRWRDIFCGDWDT